MKVSSVIIWSVTNPGEEIDESHQSVFGSITVLDTDTKEASVIRKPIPTTVLDDGVLRHPEPLIYFDPKVRHMATKVGSIGKYFLPIEPDVVVIHSKSKRGDLYPDGSCHAIHYVDVDIDISHSSKNVVWAFEPQSKVETLSLDKIESILFGKTVSNQVIGGRLDGLCSHLGIENKHERFAMSLCYVHAIQNSDSLSAEVDYSSMEKEIQKRAQTAGILTKNYPSIPIESEESKDGEV